MVAPGIETRRRLWAGVQMDGQGEGIEPVDFRSGRSGIEARRVAPRDPRGYNAAMKNRLLGQWIETQLADRPLRANSLIITIYGDMIAPHGGTVWLGGLIRLVEPLGLNPRTVRTSVFRLSREKWLVSEQIGRRSYYSLTAMGRRRFEHDFHRIYEDARVAWEGDWQIVMTPGDSP